MYLGAQLFGVLANTSLAPAEALKKLRDAGYTHVEPCLALDPLGAWEQVIWSAAEFEEYMDTIAALGLRGRGGGRYLRCVDRASSSLLSPRCRRHKRRSHTTAGGTSCVVR